MSSESASVDTKEITLPISGKKVLYRTYTTRREERAAKKITNEGMKAVIVGDEERIETSLQSIDDARELYVKSLVISIDGENRNIEEALLDLHSDDYEVIEKAIDEVVKPPQRDSDPKGTSENS